MQERESIMDIPDIPFEPWPKIPRLYREIVITEKIDGTNAGIFIPLWDEGSVSGPVYASSRKRWITPEKDNFGFARWAEENKETLIADLGPGMHYGEWWGQGIQRTYDWGEKRFSLFNVRRWGALTANEDPRCVRKGSHITHNDEKRGDEQICACREKRGEIQFATPRMGVVPVLYQGPITTVTSLREPRVLENIWDYEAALLRRNGSAVAPGFMNPEGIIVYHVVAQQAFKYTLDGDGHKEK